MMRMEFRMFLAAALALCAGTAAFADLDARMKRVMALKGGIVSSMKVTYHAKSEPEGVDPLAAWRADAKENVKLDDAFVRVDFTLVPEEGCLIKCRAQLPLPGKWDGRMWGQGNSGRAGSLPDLNAYTAVSTAAVTTDLGTSEVIRSSRYSCWPDYVLKDFHWRATHLMTVYGKRIVEAFYGKAPFKSYFCGGSTGGRQAMSEALRFPEDYDGMYITLPDHNAAVNEIAHWHLWRLTHDDEGKLLFTADQMQLVSDCAVRYRSSTDPRPYAGRIIADARFDEAEIDGFLAMAAKECPELGQEDKIARLKAIYMPLSIDGKCWFNGFAPGTYLGKCMLRNGLISLSNYFGRHGMEAKRWKDVSWKMILEYMRDIAPEFNSSDVDLTAFRKRGGKIMMTLGWEDQTVSPAPILDYYEQVCRHDGGIERTREYFRLYCLPGCAHGGGVGRAMTGSPNTSGGRRLLIQWCEQAIAPEKLTFNWRAEKMVLPVSAYPGLFVFDDNGNWTLKTVKRGVTQIDKAARVTKVKGFGDFETDRTSCGDGGAASNLLFNSSMAVGDGARPDL